MKPKNRFQKQVIALSQKLPKITEAQLKYAYQHCFKKYAKRTKKGMLTCLECGHSWKSEQTLTDTVCGCTCPNCGTELTVTDTKKRVFRDAQYFCIITVCGGFQVLRFVYIRYDVKAGEKAHRFHSEAVQRWIAPDGRHATVARLRPCGYFGEHWNFCSSLEIRPEQNYHRIAPACICQRMKLIPELKRSGFQGNFYTLHPFDLFCNVLSDSRAETLLKTGQTALLKFFAERSFGKINDYWASIKICIRNGYTVGDASMWVDYIKLLHFFGKDLHSVKYVCPAGLTAEHDRYVKKKREFQERERREQARKKAHEDEVLFNEMKARFFGVCFTDGQIQIRVLESVEEVMREGDTLKHCVFTNQYHLKPDSLILSACVNGQKTETVEFSLSRMAVVQCRGKHNQTTEYHDQIINLVNKNRRTIKKRMAA